MGETWTIIDDECPECGGYLVSNGRIKACPECGYEEEV